MAPDAALYLGLQREHRLPGNVRQQRYLERGDQQILEYGLIAGEIAGAAWLGVYALALLPAYDAVARVEVDGDWQTDVLAILALGTATGYLAHARESPFILGLWPHGFMVGSHEQF